MKGLSKKLLTALLAATAAVCLVLGLLFTVPEKASADTVTPDVTLSADYLDINEDGVFIGLKDKSEEETLAKLLPGKTTFAIALPDTVTAIGEGVTVSGAQRSVLGAYSGNLVQFTISSNVETIGNYAFYGCSALQDIAIPENVTAIGNSAFQGCTSLTSANYAAAAKLATIGASAFRGCTSLTRITVPASVTAIGDYAFNGCSSVTEVFYFARRATGSGANTFSGIGEATVTIGQEGSGNRVEQIPIYLFRGTKITAVTFNNVNITSESGIGVSAFENCTSLKTVTFTGNSVVREIRSAMFNGCTSLSQINLGDVSGLEKIGANAFQGCSSLMTITIPSTVKSIDGNAFNGCTKLLEVKNDSPDINIIKGNNEKDGGIGYYVKNVYSSTSGKTQFGADNGYNFFYYTETTGATTETTVLLVSYTGTATALNLPASVNLDGVEHREYEIYNGAFRNNTAITGVTIPAAVSVIGEYAFYGCTSLTSINIPRTVNEVKGYAFYGCTSLATATIEDAANSLSYISTYMFGNCTSLTEIVIPQSITAIRQSAFEGCSKLANVTFKAGANETYRITRIESSAFKGCSSLASVRIPNSVTTLGATVFSDCTKLEKAYLPDGLSSAQKDIFANCAEKLILIAPDAETREAYAKDDDADDEFIENFVGYTITYEIVIELFVKGTAQAATEYAYYGEHTTLPVQEGYKTSVWYSDESYINEVNETALNGLLDNKTTSKITLYANNIEKPEGVTVKQDLTYNENGYTIASMYQTLFDNWSATYDSLYKVVVSRYFNVSGEEKEVEDVTKFTDAGTYYLSVLINDEQRYGQWEEGVPVRVKVIPAQITSLEDFEWGVLSGNTINNLEPFGTDELVTVYVYGNKPYLEKQYTDSTNTVELDHDEEYEYVVCKSWLALTGHTYTLLLKGDIQYGTSSQYIKSVKYSNNTGTSWGIYTTFATVILDNNYKLPAGTGVDNGILKNQGITIGYDATTNEYHITKNWYVIASNANKLLSEDGNSVYTISNWTYSYKGDTVITKPTLLYGEGEEETLISYTLSFYPEEGMTEAAAVFTFKHSAFNQYVTAAMPAGSYTLSVTIKDYVYTDDSNTEQTNPGTGDVPYTYNFTVEKADLNILLKDENGNGGYLDAFFDGDFLNSKTLYAEYTGDKTFGNTKSVMPILTLKPEQLHPIDLRYKSIWGEEEFDKYYTEFIITYRIAGDSGIYATAEDYTNAPYDIGGYTVYYNIYAPGYDESFNDSSANRYYTLYIQGVIGAPAIDVEYTGKTWAEKINFNSRFFEVVYLNDGNTKSENIRKELIEKNVAGIGEKDEYILSGTHRVVLMLNDDYQTLARWNNNELTVIEDGLYGTYAIFAFTIEKAANYTTQKLQLKPWDWGGYDENINVPQWSTQFVTEYNFMLVSKTNSDDVYYYQPLGKDQRGFGKAHAGDYWLKPIASGTDNIREFNTSLLDDENEWLEVTILRAEIKWEVTATPRIDSWKYGDDRNFTAPSGTLAEAFSDLQGKWSNYFCLYTDYLAIRNGETGVKTYSNFKELQEASEEGYVPAGSYVYVYELSASANDDYNSWIHPVYFSVLKADNYWDVTPVIHDRSYGDENKLSDITYIPHFGDVKSVEFEYWYIDENGIASPLPANVKGSELEIGRYEYKVTLKGSTNYDILEFSDYFTVSKADNGWVKVPNVIGWSEGRYAQEKNSPVAESKFGTVFFTIKDAHGDVVNGFERLSLSELNYEKLNSLGVGTYTLIAEVAGTANYEELSAETHFAVFEDSVGMTGLIATTIVFAVIAVGLAVAGVILLIRKNKKMEEEFRRMVRSEMRRR